MDTLFFKTFLNQARTGLWPALLLCCYLHRESQWRSGDDLLIVVPPHSSHFKEELQVLLQCFDMLGVPVAERKLVGPTDCLTFLGIELDTTHMIKCLPAHKLRELKELVEEEELQVLLQCFDMLGVPMAERKLVGPTDCLTILGIELDTTHMIRRLPAHKLRELKELVEEWLLKKLCRVRELQSLVSKLQHACKVVRPGRTFLRRMFELLKGGASKQPWVRLNTSFRSDLLRWYQFLESWNGVAMLENGPRQGREVYLYTDASGSFGGGAYWGSHWL